MMERQTQEKHQDPRHQSGINQVTVCGYKCISNEQSIDIRPLTILAGANSSGKSSIMQPLLLLKQTLEASYDPGALLLNGPNVRFTSADQLLSHTRPGEHRDIFCIGIRTGTNQAVTFYFKQEPNRGFGVEKMTYWFGNELVTLRLGMSHAELVPLVPANLGGMLEMINERDKYEWRVVRDRCFLQLALGTKGSEATPFSAGLSPGPSAESSIRELIHLPGLRGNPERTYPVTAVGSTFPGTFEDYTASLISDWQEKKEATKLHNLNNDLERLGLTWKVAANRINDTQVELEVGRMAHAIRGGARDLVNVADVGLGLSQTLPVLVALHAAKPGQLVYLEQPEIHLHPSAQWKLAEVLADVASRGVRVVAETHSSLLLLGVQTHVAEGKVPPELVKLHWFEKRKEDGITEVRSSDLDESGAFGDWPEDFAKVALEAESRYLEAAESRAKYG